MEKIQEYQLQDRKGHKVNREAEQVVHKDRKENLAKTVKMERVHTNCGKTL